MYRTQKRNEEFVTVRTENIPTRASGGYANITIREETGIYAVIEPDTNTYISDEQGAYIREKSYALVRETEMAKCHMEEGKTQIIWNGNTYRVIGIIDQTERPKFRNAEITMVRRVDVDGSSTW